MDPLHTHVAGLDVHKKTVVVCAITPGILGGSRYETRTFGTMTGDLLQLADWLTQRSITHVAMEGTGEFWKPIYNLLESSFAVLVVNAQHIKNVPGRKTDVQDAQWIAQLLQHGLLRGSFIPPLPQRDLRDLTRQRTNLVRELAMVVNRLQKVLEWANIKLAGVASDITGVSARAMLAAIADGETDPEVLADLAKRRLRSKRPELEQALEGRVRDHHRFMIAEHLHHMVYLEDTIDRYDARIQQAVAVLESETPGPTGSQHGHAEERESSDTPEGTATSSGSALATKQEATESPVTGNETAPPSSPFPTTEEIDQTLVDLLDTIPGVGRTIAHVLLAEIGADMSRFPSAKHLARWARICPGNHESAGKQPHGKTGHGNTWLKSALVQAAHAAVKVKGSYLAKVYRRLVKRRGVKKAIMAVAHRIVIIIYHMLSKREPYRDYDSTARDERLQQRQVRELRRKIETLGYTVQIAPKPSEPEQTTPVATAA